MKTSEDEVLLDIVDGLTKCSSCSPPTKPESYPLLEAGNCNTLPEAR